MPTRWCWSPAPSHPLARRTDVTIKDLEGEPFILHRLCSTTEQKSSGCSKSIHVRCRIVAEVRSFENIKSLVEEDVGLAIVPNVTVQQEIAAGTLMRVKLPELSIPRQTFMIYRDVGQHSHAAREITSCAASIGRSSPARSCDRFASAPDDSVSRGGLRLSKQLDTCVNAQHTRRVHTPTVRPGVRPQRSQLSEHCATMARPLAWRIPRQVIRR